MLKFRGGKTLRGKHAFQISNDGLRVYPRTEVLYDQPPSAMAEHHYLSLGAPGFDHMLDKGGLPGASATVVVGSTGTGKTSLCLHFLSCCTEQEPGLYFGFFESPDRVRSTAESFGLEFRALEARGALSLMWHPQSEHLLDELAHRMLETVAAKGIKRLVIDGLAGFFEAASHSERLGRFFAVLTNELRRRGVTVLMSLETRDAIGSSVPMPYGVSALVDNLIYLRFVENNGELKRLVSIIKLRNSVFNPGTFAFSIDGRGMLVHGRYSAGGDVIPHADAVAAKSPDPRSEGQGRS